MTSVFDQIPQVVHPSPDSAAPAPGATAADVAETPDLDALDVAACPACPHPLAAHDAIDLRFCRATITRGQPRGCTCCG